MQKLPVFSVPPHELSSLGKLRAASRNPLQMWDERYYRDMVIENNVLGQKDIVFNDPEAIRQVLSEQWKNYQKPTVTRRLLLPQAGYGLFLAEGERWRRQRRVLSPAFTPRNMEKLLPSFISATQGWIDSLKDEPKVNLSHEIQRLTLKIAAHSIFSRVLEAKQERDVTDMFRTYALRMGSPNFFDIIATTDDGFAFATRKRQAFKKRWFAMIEEFLAERLALPDNGHVRDIVDLLLEAKDTETGEGLSHEEIVEEIATLTAAGFDTTSRSLFWTLYLLALYPQWQEIVRLEANSIEGLLESPTMEKIGLLSKTKCVWQEAMRLYPPGSIITRRAMVSHRIMDTEVKKGAMVVIAPWLMHRHHAYWQNPDDFDPTRFSEENISNIPKGVYMPFGTGPRVCIGAMFATAESLLAIAAIVKHWKISLYDTKPVQPVMLTATMPSYEPIFNVEPIVG